MITICPKCCVVRPAQAQSPNWQCPSCGLAYAKASGGSAAWGLAEVSPSDRGGVGSGESEIDNVPCSNSPRCWPLPMAHGWATSVWPQAVRTTGQAYQAPATWSASVATPAPSGSHSWWPALLPEQQSGSDSIQITSARAAKTQFQALLPIKSSTSSIYTGASSS